jgi:hypothetical protein
MVNVLPVSTSLDGAEMTKPDYITFSQEIFDECESIRRRVVADWMFTRTDEYKNKALELSDYFLSDEYQNYLTEIKKK